MEPDVIESGPDTEPPRRIAAGLAVILIVAAGVAGYWLGSRRGPASPAPSVTPAVSDPILATAKRCAVQLKDRLQLGIEILNQSATTVTLHRVRPDLPLTGLRATSTTWGSCGQLPPAASGDYPLPAGATTWLTITFDVLVDCPSPIPVRFSVDYDSGTVDLPGFPDLGNVEC